MMGKLRKLLHNGLTCGALMVISLPAMALPINGTLSLDGKLSIGPTFLNFCGSATAGDCPSAVGNWNPPGLGNLALANPYADDSNGGMLTNLNNVNAPVGTLLPGNGILFLTFTPSVALPTPDIEFYLTKLFAGVGGTANCGSAPAAGQICSPTGSAVTFLNGAGGNSSATITALGRARRISSNEFDPLQMVFTAQFNTPFQGVLANLSVVGTITMTYSASFTATPPPVFGDYNQNLIVDAADYTVWRDHLGQTFVLPNRSVASTGPIANADYTFWKAQFGQHA